MAIERMAGMKKLGFDMVAKALNLSSHRSPAREKFQSLDERSKFLRNLIFLASMDVTVLPISPDFVNRWSKTLSTVWRKRGNLRSPQRFLRSIAEMVIEAAANSE
jgi:hypothetical protein